MPLIAALLGLMALLQGCVILPYRPSAETRHDVVQVPEPESVRLTVGPRKFLEELANDILERDKRFSQFDAQTFIDTASPDAELTLARLLDPTTRPRVEPLGIDYLVLLGQPRIEITDKWGEVGIYFGFFGLAKRRESATAWAAVIDLPQLQLVEQLSSRATGIELGAGLFYGLFVASDTEGAVQDGMARHVVRTIAGAKPGGPVRLVFLAEERIPTLEEVAAQKQAELPPPPPSLPVEQVPPFTEAPSPPP